MNNVVLGFYLPTNTYLHRLDPRIKFFILIFLITSIFLYSGVEGYICLSFFTIIIFITAKIPFSSLKKMIIPIIIMFLFLVFIGFFITSPPAGNTNSLWKPLFSINIGRFHHIVYNQAIYRAIYIIWRILLMFSITVCYTSTTKPVEITLSIEHIFFFLKYIKIPVHIIAMMMMIAIRFIPDLFNETIKISKAQISRGVNFREKGLKNKAGKLSSLVLPIFIGTFQRANDLADAMIVRGYNPYAKRTSITKFKISWTDIAAILFVICFLVLIILIGIGVHDSMHNTGSVLSHLAWFYNWTHMEPLLFNTM